MAVEAPLFDQCMRSIAWYGRVLVIGFVGDIPKVPTNLILLKSCQVVGVFWGAWTLREPEEARRQFATLLDWTASGELRPHISLRLPLDRTLEGYEAIRGRKTTGKVVIEVR